MRVGRMVACAVAAVLVAALAGCTGQQRDDQQDNLDAIARLPGVASVADVIFKTECDALCSAVTATVVVDDSLTAQGIRQLRDRITAGLVNNTVSHMGLALRQGAATIPVDAEDMLFDLWDRVRTDPRFAAVAVVRDDVDKPDKWVLQLSVPSKSDLAAGLAAGVEVAPPSASLSLRIVTMSRNYSVRVDEGNDFALLKAATNVLAEKQAPTGFTLAVTSTLNVELTMPQLRAVPDTVTSIATAFGAVPSADHASVTVTTPDTSVYIDALTTRESTATAAAWAILGTGVVPTLISIRSERDGGGIRVTTDAIKDAKRVNKLLETHPEFRKLSEYIVYCWAKNKFRTFSFGEEELPRQRS